MKADYYQILGLNSSATIEEIRRAYRILARRYHPDVNPGKASEDRFKSIAEAYRVLGDPAKRKAYDVDYEGMLRSGAYTKKGSYASGPHTSARRRFYEAKFENFGKIVPEEKSEAEPPPSPRPASKQSSRFSEAAAALNRVANLFSEQWKRARESEKKQSTREKPKPHIEREVKKISILEVSVAMPDAIQGVKKTVEIAEPEGAYKVSLNIPPGVRNGSVLRLTTKAGLPEDLVFIVRVAQHPFLHLQAKGLIVDLPISLAEAIMGATISAPGLAGALTLKIPAGSQSGTEIRLQGQGIVGPEGARGDLFYRLMIRVPTIWQAVGIKEKVQQLEAYYDRMVRQGFPVHHLLEQAA